MEDFLGHGHHLCRRLFIFIPYNSCAKGIIDKKKHNHQTKRYKDKGQRQSCFNIRSAQQISVSSQHSNQHLSSCISCRSFSIYR